MQSTLFATGTFATDRASSYLQQLCKHFGHKVDVTFDAHSGTVALPVGPCHLSADGTTLRAEVSAADTAGLDRARHVIDDHLKRFAFRENFEQMDWA